MAKATTNKQATIASNQAEVRKSIIDALRANGVKFVTRSEWGAKEVKATPDWNYKSIAIHHAGNSYSCSVSDLNQISKVQKTDISKFQQLSYHYAISCNGTIYELLDIRSKGSHIVNGNTGVIGIVILADLSLPNEAYEQEYSKQNNNTSLGVTANMFADMLDGSHNKLTDIQMRSVKQLVSVLQLYFGMSILGGHREFQVLANKEGRACPGLEGMKIVTQLRKEFGFIAPNSKNYPHLK